MTPTADPDTFIELREGDTTIYVRSSDRLRWKATGRCDRRGFCMIGSVVSGVTIKDLDHLATLCDVLGVDRIDSELDVPIAPGFSGCCPFEIEVLSDGN